MRKSILSVATLVIATLALGILAGQIRAQEATPTPIGPTGTTGALLASAVPVAAPDQTLSLRITTFAPGAIIPLHTHPGTLVVWLESGSITFGVQEGTLVVTRAPKDGAEGVVETFGAGEETVIEAGDSLVEEGGQYIVTNPGDSEAVVYFAALTTTDAPVTEFVQ